MSATIDTYLDYLRDDRRLSPNTLESYARDLAALAAFAEGKARAVETLDRRDLEAFVRQLMASGLSPRSVARRSPAFAALPVPGARAADRGRARPTICARRAPGRRCRSFLARGSRSAARAAGCRDAARPARPGADRAALRDRPARLRAAVASRRRSAISTRAT